VTECHCHVQLPLADDELLRRFGGLLSVLAEQNGLSNPQLGQAQGEIIVTVGPGADGFNMAEFEMATESLIRARVAATSSRAPGAISRGALPGPKPVEF